MGMMPAAVKKGDWIELGGLHPAGSGKRWAIVNRVYEEASIIEALMFDHGNGTPFRADLLWKDVWWERRHPSPDGVSIHSMQLAEQLQNGPNFDIKKLEYDEPGRTIWRRPRPVEE